MATKSQSPKQKQLNLELIKTCGDGMGSLEDAKALVKKGADANSRDSNGLTPLMALMKNPYQNKRNPKRETTAFVKYLISEGADVNARDNNGCTPLHYLSIFSGEVSALRVLIEKGADIRAKDVNGDTPLHLAGQYGEKDVFMLLMVRGANPQAKNKEGKTPLELWDENVEAKLGK